MIKVYFLGTNGWFPTSSGHTTCHLIDAPEAYIILDAGTGILNIDKFIKQEKPLYLFLSHLHFDHIFGLHILNKFNFEQGMTVVIHNDYLADLLNIFRQPYTVSHKDLPFKVDILPVKNGYNNSFPFGLLCLEQIHSAPCFGYRFEFLDKTIAYCTDTGKCSAVNQLADNADLLITECALLDGEINHIWPHMNPADAAESAKSAKAKQLATIHYDAEKYPDLESRKIALRKSKHIFQNTVMTSDDTEILV